ncbi:MAG: hypothetical protein CK425_06405 [Parachlamydia sp.]|nr:MAG: hypothetical protein CK425_06405 [Parachlamydia sp.]
MMKTSIRSSLEGTPLLVSSTNQAAKFGPIQAGDILTCQKGNLMTSTGQRALMRGSSLANSTHVAVVRSVGKKRIVLLEAINQKDRKGVYVTEYTPETFREEFMGVKGVHVLRNDQLSKTLRRTIRDFAKAYGKEGEAKAKYGIKHLASTTLKTAKDNDKGRLRTVHSYHDGRLMTSKGKERDKSICSELVAEIVKISQIKKETKKGHLKGADLTAKVLKKLQAEGKVLNVSSEHVSVGRIEKELIKHGFHSTAISRDGVYKTSERPR